MSFPIGQPSGLRFASQSQDNLPIGVWGLCASKHTVFLRPKQPLPGSGSLSVLNLGVPVLVILWELGKVSHTLVAGKHGWTDSKRMWLKHRGWAPETGCDLGMLASCLRASEDIPFFLAPVPANFKPCHLRVGGEAGSLGFHREGESESRTATLVASVFRKGLKGQYGSIEDQGCELKSSLPRAQLHT